MNEVYNLNKIRLTMLKNFLIYKLKKTPSLISIVVICLVLLYFITEMSISPELVYFSLNPNIVELTKTYTYVFFRLLYFTLLITGPVYIFLSKINLKSYHQYCHLNLTFKNISHANYNLFIAVVDLIVVLLFSILLFHTNSTFLSIIIFFCMFIPTINIQILIINYVYQIGIAMIIKHCRRIHIHILEFMMIVPVTLLGVSIINQIPIFFALQTPVYYTVLALIVVYLVLKFLYQKIPLENIVNYTQIKKEKKIIKVKGSMSIIKNYVLLLYNMKDIYLEYIISFIILLLIILNTELNKNKEIVFQFIVLFSLISNGVIYSYKDWFSFHKKKVMQDTLRIDFLISFICNILLSIAISYVLYSQLEFRYILFSCLTYVILNVVQSKVKLMYVNNGKSPVIFVVLYGALAFVSFLLMQKGYELCI